MSSSSSRQQRSAALAKYREIRRNGGERISRLDEITNDNDDTNDGIYDYVEEDEYRRLVESRRQRDDFVVDDDGLGYYDDGEEHFGDNDDNYDTSDDRNNNSKRRKTSANAALTAAALRKAKKAKMALSANGDDDDGDDETTSKTGCKNKSMWDFVNRGIAASSSSSLVSDRLGKKKLGSSVSNNKPSVDIDALLQQLDDPLVLQSEKRTVSSSLLSSARRNATVGRNFASSTSRRQYDSLPSSTPFVSKTNKKIRFQSDLEQYDDYDNERDGAVDFDNGDYNDDDDDNNNYDVNNNNNDDDNDDMVDNLHNISTTNYNESPTIKRVRSTRNNDDQKLQNDNAVSNDSRLKSSDEDSGIKDPVDTTKTDNTVAVESKTEDIETPAPADPIVPRRRLARPKLSSIMDDDKPSVVASSSSTDGESSSKQQQHHQKQPVMHFAANTIPMTSSLSSTASDLLTGSGMSGGTKKMDLEEFIKKNEAQSNDVDTTESNKNNNIDPYIDMFWMDIRERSGDIYLYGKVQLPGTSSKGKSEFVSACAVVTGNVRNLFVLPKKLESGYASMTDVHSEINTLLNKQKILPQSAGSSWAGKPVDRQYAFGDESIPREETKYLKVVYDSKYPLPSEEACQGPGEYYDKILGAGSSDIENFIIKRKLMGPCWIRLRNPHPTKATVSWCKVEFHITDPKHIQRLDLVIPSNNVPPTPPVVCMSLQMKTVVNPKTHKSEIACVSVLCHNNVQLETSTDESPKNLVQLSLVRPIGQFDGSTSGIVQFPRDIDKEIATGMPQLQRMPNERALLNRLMAQIGMWDPDVIVGHNAWGFDIEVLLTRCIEHKLPGTVWSKIGRRYRTDMPSKTYFSTRKEMAIIDAISGRLLCDTYLSAKELVKDTTYSLTNLSATLLKTPRQEILPADVPSWYSTSTSIVNLAQTTLYDAHLVQRLLFKLQILPLTKQLTCIAGNIWSHTMKGNRAERTEYLLLHEFHRMKFLVPEKRRPGSKDKGAKSDGKAKYSGGLVLEPKKGLYDSFILLLDFNSLYPSIIQEYNLCFTTIDWSHYNKNLGPSIATDDKEGEEINVSKDFLPPLPDSSLKVGVLPKVIKSLVERRQAVKTLLKNEKNEDKKVELDIRQKAIKLTANSMYGCLGFSNSRFFAKPIAALVTATGREILHRAVDIAQDKVGLEVIYGDTDSIMINTRINDEKMIAQVRELGEQVKREVNKLYRTLELEIDGIFRKMLLLKKKKYAAKTVEVLPNGELKYDQEFKGLDQVRRDWCIQSKETGRYVTEQILSDQDNEAVANSIFTHLETLAKDMREGTLPIEKYVITKGLSKHPDDYPDAKAQAHVLVARQMIKHDRPVNVGDHIPYVVTTETTAADNSDKPAATMAERARHPDEIKRSNGELKPDVEWYLAQQILPPISRLCEQIEGMTQQVLAEKLGMDGSKFRDNAGHRSSGMDLDGDIDVDYTPASCLPDNERFKDVEKLQIYCLSCHQLGEFPGVFNYNPAITERKPVSGLYCTNPDCDNPKLWGHGTHFDLYSRLSNAMSIWARGLMTKYYQGIVRCDEPCCALETRQLSVCTGQCLRPGCGGTMHPIVTERNVHNHLKYLETVFNENHQWEQIEMAGKQKLSKQDRDTALSKHDRETFKELYVLDQRHLQSSAFNWIAPSFWKALFPPTVKPITQ